MTFVNRQYAEMMLSNFCHLSESEQEYIIEHIDLYTYDGMTYAFPSSQTDSRTVFHELVRLYAAIKEKGHGRLSIGLTPNDLVGYSYGLLFINSDVTTYRMQETDTTMQVPYRVGAFYKLPFNLNSVKEVVTTYATIGMSRYFFSERIQTFGKLIRDFLCRYDEYTTWQKKVKDRNYRNEASFRKQVDILTTPNSIISQQVTAAYNIFTWAGIEITDALTRSCEPWKTLRADGDALIMIQDIIEDAASHKEDPFRNPTLPGVTADMHVEPEYDVEFTEEEWLAEVVTKELAAKALNAYSKSIDHCVLKPMKSYLIDFNIDPGFITQHIYQYRNTHDIQLVPTGVDDGWRYILRDENGKTFILFSDLDISAIYGLHVNRTDPNELEMIIIEKDKKNRYTFTG